jgi:hypothetical protein
MAAASADDAAIASARALAVNAALAALAPHAAVGAQANDLAALSVRVNEEARRLVNEIRRAFEVAGELTGAWVPAGGALRPKHLLLARPPTAALNSYIWDVVCLAAVGPIRHGLGRMNAPMLEPENRGRPAAVSPAAAAAAGHLAVHKFWFLLADFCALGLAPPKLRSQVHPHHPQVRARRGENPKTCTLKPALFSIPLFSPQGHARGRAAHAAVRALRRSFVPAVPRTPQPWSYELCQNPTSIPRGILPPTYVIACSTSRTSELRIGARIV